MSSAASGTTSIESEDLALEIAPLVAMGNGVLRSEIFYGREIYELERILARSWLFWRIE